MSTDQSFIEIKNCVFPI